jgi:hypothetical protein
MDSDTRLWMYRKGEARLFGHPDHVPEGEAWQRFPLAACEADGSPVQGLSTPGEDKELSQEEKLERMSRKRLMKVAADCGVCFDISWTKAQLKQAINEVLHGNRA